MAGTFLKQAGTDGFIGTKRVVTASSWLASLAGGARAISDNTADTGIFSQSSFGNCQYGMAWLEVVTAGWTPTQGGVIACWWNLSPDGGSTFETESRTTPSTTVPAVARPPDFIIPVYTGGTALSVGDIYFAVGPFPLPYQSAKLIAQNFTGATLGAGNHKITIAGVQDGYS